MIGEGIIVISKKLENEKLGGIDIHTYPLPGLPHPCAWLPHRPEPVCRPLSSHQYVALSHPSSLSSSDTCAYNTYYVNYDYLLYLIILHIVMLIIDIINH